LRSEVRYVIDNTPHGLPEHEHLLAGLFLDWRAGMAESEGVLISKREGGGLLIERSRKLAKSISAEANPKGYARQDDGHSSGITLDRREILKMAGAAVMASAGISHTPPASAESFRPLPPPEAGAPLSIPPVVFPEPREMSLGDSAFRLDQHFTIVLPAVASANDLFLARFLTHELSDRYDQQPPVKRTSSWAGSERFILMGSIQNPLVRQYCAQHQVEITEKNPGHEGYVLRVDESGVLIAGSDGAGAFYGLQSLRQLIVKADTGLEIRGASIRDWPDKPFRGVKLYLPGRDDIQFFRRFIRNFVALYKFNKLMMEMNACMRLDRHPELNAGWVEFARDTNYSRRNYPPGVPHEIELNSSHHDTADGGFLEKDEVADLVRWTEQNFIEVVPEIPSLTHSFYLLTKHQDLSQVPGEKWPDTYCACNPKSYELLFDVMDEYIEVMKPKMVHTGHDEWFAPFGLGDCCKGKDPGDIYGRDLRRIHAYLAKKGIKMAIWGDYLLENVRGKGPQKRTAPDGFAYSAPGAMTPQQVKEGVPKDILIFNWFWSEEEKGEANEAQLDELGFRQVYGNMEPDLLNYTQRSKRATIMGGAPSSWAATTPFNMSKDLLFSILGCSNMLWSKKARDRKELSQVTQSLMPGARLRLSGATPPSETDPVTPVDVSASLNMSPQESTFGVDLGGIERRVASGAKVFDLKQSAEGKVAIIVGTEGREPNPLPREIAGISIGEDATSLLFLHACAKPATNKEAYRLIWDFDDSADLLGWYEVVYEDGLPEVIPIRYGINILEWNWGGLPPSGKYCYGADLVKCGQSQDNPITFFAFEWTSPRLGKVIKEVRLKGSTRFRGAVPGFENSFGEVIPNNAVLLAAISLTKKRA
jgi:hypothetical protein